MTIFVQKLQKRVATLALGDGLLDTTDVGPVINEKAVERIGGYVHIGQKEAELVWAAIRPATATSPRARSSSQPCSPT